MMYIYIIYYLYGNKSEKNEAFSGLINNSMGIGIKMIKTLNTNSLRSELKTLNAGDEILLSGAVYSARDAAHKKFFSLLDEGLPLPIDIKDAVIYYCGPTPPKAGMAIGACGPTTSSRMDLFTPRLMKLGLCATIGKGERSEEVRKAIIENSGIYLCAMGGAGAIAAQSIISVETVAFPELGCESVKLMQFKDFPLIVGIDHLGNSIFNFRNLK